MTDDQQAIADTEVRVHADGEIRVDSPTGGFAVIADGAEGVLQDNLGDGETVLVMFGDQSYWIRALRLREFDSECRWIGEAQ